MKKQLDVELRVICFDGQAGKISNVVIDPDRNQPTHLVVKSVRLYLREILVPVSLVAEVTQEAVFLNVTRETLVGLSNYEFTVRKGVSQEPPPVEYPRPRYMSYPKSNNGTVVLRKRNVPERSVAVQKGMAILDVEGHKVGQVDGIIVDFKKQQGLYLLFHRVHETIPRLIPADLIEDVSDQLVRLRIDREYMKRLPVYTRRTAHRWERERETSLK